MRRERHDIIGNKDPWREALLLTMPCLKSLATYKDLVLFYKTFHAFLKMATTQPFTMSKSFEKIECLRKSQKEIM